MKLSIKYQVLSIKYKIINLLVYWVIGILGYSRRMAGFTLIEVLVAATIVALLSTIGLSGYQAITRSGRDALRKSDLEQIRSALEIYKSEKGNYPTPQTTCVPALPSSYINPYPADPRPASSKYCYVRQSNLTYQLCAHLENGAAADSYCGSLNLCTASCNYQVVNP